MSWQFELLVGAMGQSSLTLVSMIAQAYLYFQAGELLAAEATFRDALDIYRAVWSSDADRDSCMAQLTGMFRWTSL